MESHRVEFSEPEHSSPSQFSHTETDANRLTDAVQDAISPDDAGIYVSSEELAQIVEMKTQFDQARIDVDQLREELRTLQESYDNYKLLSEKKVKDVQEEAQEAYKQRMTTSRDLQLARSETEDMRSKLSAKLSEFQLLRHDHTATASLLALAKKELESEKAHSATLADQLREANERIAALVEVDRDQEIAAAKADEVRVQVLQRACARAQTELAREREQAVALRKVIERQQREVADVNKAILALEREAMTCLPVESDVVVVKGEDVHASIGAETSNTLGTVKKRLTAVRERLQDAGKETIDDDAVWEARRDGFVLLGVVLAVSIISITISIVLS